jgi:hypothetical protein
MLFYILGKYSLSHFLKIPQTLYSSLSSGFPEALPSNLERINLRIMLSLLYILHNVCLSYLMISHISESQDLSIECAKLRYWQDTQGEICKRKDMKLQILNFTAYTKR